MDKEAIFQFGAQYGLKKTTLDSYIVRSLARKDFFSFKRGFYITYDFYNKNKDDISYTFFLANILCTPSYVTSVTPKITRTYAAKANTLTYQSIKKELFSDFSLVKGKFDFFIEIIFLYHGGNHCHGIWQSVRRIKLCFASAAFSTHSSLRS